MAKSSLSIKLTETQFVKDMFSLFKAMLKDERISKEVRDYYKDKVDTIISNNEME